MLLLIITFFSLSLVSHAGSVSVLDLPVFPPCDPVSKILKEVVYGEPSTPFCAKWDPNFHFRGYGCCKKISTSWSKSFSRGQKARLHHQYCKEVTPEQSKYIEWVKNGKVKDVLSLIQLETGAQGDQAYCSEHDGFLAYGRPLVPTATNRIQLRAPELCFNFGTDSMVGMLEWLGREIGKTYPDPDYSGSRLIIGDISAPRGGPLYGRTGRRRHLSHASGQDVDIGFLQAKKKQDSPLHFTPQFDPQVNWWLIQSIFKNPFACVKVLFLDRRHIRTLNRFAKKDKNWLELKRFVRHMPGHKNHLHVRIGKGPGRAGCHPDAHPELELEADDHEVSQELLVQPG